MGGMLSALFRGHFATLDADGNPKWHSSMKIAVPVLICIVPLVGGVISGLVSGTCATGCAGAFISFFALSTLVSAGIWKAASDKYGVGSDINVLGHNVSATKFGVTGIATSILGLVTAIDVSVHGGLSSFGKIFYGCYFGVLALVIGVNCPMFHEKYNQRRCSECRRLHCQSSNFLFRWSCSHRSNGRMLHNITWRLVHWRCPCRHRSRILTSRCTHFCTPIQVVR